MGYLSAYAQDSILDHLLKNTPFTRPANLFLGLCEGDPTEDGTGVTITEPTDGSYARQSCDGWTAAASRATAINTAIAFPNATADWDTITHFAILDTATLATGNLIAYGPISPARTISSGDAVQINNGNLDVSANARGLSDYLANSLLDHIFANTPYSQPGNIYIALSTATMVDNDTGTTITEPGGNYARCVHNSWTTATGGVSLNSGAIAFITAATADWGTITHVGLCDALTTGNLLMHGTVKESLMIEIGDVAQFATERLAVATDKSAIAGARAVTATSRNMSADISIEVTPYAFMGVDGEHGMIRGY